MWSTSSGKGRPCQVPALPHPVQRSSTPRSVRARFKRLLCSRRAAAGSCSTSSSSGVRCRRPFDERGAEDSKWEVSIPRDLTRRLMWEWFPPPRPVPEDAIRPPWSSKRRQRVRAPPWSTVCPPARSVRSRCPFFSHAIQKVAPRAAPGRQPQTDHGLGHGSRRRGCLRQHLMRVRTDRHLFLPVRPRVRGLVRSNEPVIGPSRPSCGEMRKGPYRFLDRSGTGPSVRVLRQNFGSGDCAWTSSAASSGVSTEGGEPSRGLLAVSFMQATETTPTRAAAIA